jgi:hypothetical protein
VQRIRIYSIAASDADAPTSAADTSAPDAGTAPSAASAP